MSNLNPMVKPIAKSYLTEQSPRLDNDADVLMMLDKAYELLDYIVYGETEA